MRRTPALAGGARECHPRMQTLDSIVLIAKSAKIQKNLRALRVLRGSKITVYLLWAEALAFEMGSGFGPGKKRELSALVGCA